jgi:uncharacterized protein
VTRAATIFRKFSAAALKLPIKLYRYTLSPLLGQHCRHMPSCSQYGLDAIELNGAWRGFWLTLSRVLRCHPWGTSGFDPAPDICKERHPLWAAWRYGRWNNKQVEGCRHGQDHH